MAIDEELKAKFFQGMSYAAATVNVITSDGPAGRVGLTVSAMSSVSADTPRPTLLVCINENSAAAASVLKNGVFCVNVLHNHQSYISDVFAIVANVGGLFAISEERLSKRMRLMDLPDSLYALTQKEPSMDLVYD